MKRIIVLGVVLCLVNAAQANNALSEIERVSVVAISQNPSYSRYEKTLRTAMESVLVENGIHVLDVEKSKKLRNNWDQLNNPASLVTAEDFIERAERYAIDGILTLYYDVEVREVMAGFFSATAVVTSRVVTSEADVKGSTPRPMGALGYAPSDGLTASAAIVNALRRESDRVAAHYEMELLAPQSPRFIDLQLKQASLPANAHLLARGEAVPADLQRAVMAGPTKTGIRRTVSCSTMASESVGAIGIYIRDMDLQFGPTYGSSLGIIDARERKLVNELVFHEVNKSAARVGSAKIEDCLFFNGWRFLFGIAERGLKMYDVEKGKVVAELEIPDKIKGAELAIYRSGKRTFLRGYNRSRDFVLELVVDR
ncbi:MAG: hypothetical protein U5K56_13095 [Halioglobus sp.]|nr:hypothetical protein [Halioglobus sp.]